MKVTVQREPIELDVRENVGAKTAEVTVTEEALKQLISGRAEVWVGGWKITLRREREGR